MIFSLNNNFVDSLPIDDLCEFCSKIIEKAHFMLTDSGDTLQKIKDAINAHGSTKDKKRLCVYGTKLLPTALQRKYYTTYTPIVGEDMNWLMWLAEKPGYLILENSHNEWDLYRYFIELYKKDRDFGSLFVELRSAFDNYRIEPRNAGGFNGMIKEKNRITHKPCDGNKYVNQKTMMLFDRDTDNDTYFDKNKNKLFHHLCKKKHTTLTDSDVYTLNQPTMKWHMWYKRAIENYIPSSFYNSLGMHPKLAGIHSHQWDYLKIDSDSMVNYEKSKLAELGSSGIGRSDLEKNMKSFYCDIAGKNLTEMQLFLLKLVSIL